MIILYTTHCPKCKILQKKLYEKNIRYQEETSVEKMIELGLTQVPVLSVDGNLLSFQKANEWINHYEN